jgi:hypothetical protein
VTAVTDTFGAGLSPWDMWSWVNSSGFTTNLGAAVGGDNTTTGGYYGQGSFQANQYSRGVMATVPSSGWVGLTTRQSGNGGNGYLAIYDSGTFYLFAENGQTTPPLLASVTGTLNAGDILTLTSIGTVHTLYQNGTQILQVTDSTTSSGAPGLAFFDDTSTVSWWSGGDNLVSGAAPGLVTQQTSLVSGLYSFNSLDYSNGGSNINTIRALTPTAPNTRIPHWFCYCLTVEPEQSSTFGNPLNILQAAGLHNSMNCTFIQLGYYINPWYGNNPDSATTQQETAFLNSIPWVRQNFAVTGTEQISLLGFSKSGLGGLGLLMRNQSLVRNGAFWDFPAMITDAEGDDATNGSQVGGGSAAVYGTDANYEANYMVSNSTWISTYKGPFTAAAPRIWFGGYADFQDDVAAIESLYTTDGISHVATWNVDDTGGHAWDLDWMTAGINFLAPAPSGSGLLMAAGII